MSIVIGNIATFAFVPVVIAYFGVLFYTQRIGTHADLKRLVTTFALPIFTTLNTLTLVARPPTALTRGFSVLWLAVATLGGCWIALGIRQPSLARVERRYAIAALILCVAVAARNIVYLVT